MTDGNRPGREFATRADAVEMFLDIAWKFKLRPVAGLINLSRTLPVVGNTDDMRCSEPASPALDPLSRNSSGNLQHPRGVEGVDVDGNFRFAKEVPVLLVDAPENQRQWIIVVRPSLEVNWWVEWIN